MNIVIAMESFKGSLSSVEAGTVIKNTIEKVMPDAEVRVCLSARRRRRGHGGGTYPRNGRCTGNNHRDRLSWKTCAMRLWYPCGQPDCNY